MSACVHKQKHPPASGGHSVATLFDPDFICKDSKRQEIFHFNGLKLPWYNLGNHLGDDADRDLQSFVTVYNCKSTYTPVI